jgi:hypothetical protein
MAKKLDIATQLQLLARIARGDSYTQISKDTEIPITTIQSVKERNTAALVSIQDKLVAHTISTSKKQLTKAQDIIDKKLDRIKEDKEPASLTELNAIQREAFHQSQIESGKPTSINATDTEAQLIHLADAIKNGDDLELYKIVFKPGEQRETPVIPA